ncbi:hypothetical protein M0811_03444 [Anaeramoeba ignava]|uniref:Uncharacterized protein n=1 Tax=Anaeramoeba ignava TaxID=1746090 RepID=A0A9Q0L4Z1_ANAIG|nr:hypothetical protein M0811_03444 [Anaeramoeba ignava]
MSEETKKQVKLIIVGDQESKKTEMIMTYANGQYPTDYVPTVFDNYVKNLFVDGNEFELSLWDTAGQEDYDMLRPLAYPGTNVVLICFSIDNKNSFENVKNKWIPEINQYLPNVPFILVGTQSELRDDFQTINKLSQKGLSPISYQQGFGLSIEVKATKYIECSARNQVNINEVFEEAVRAVNYSSEFDTTENYSEQQNPFDVGFEKPFDIGFEKPLQTNETAYQEETKKQVKLIIVGDQESKKTEMIMTYANGQYPTDYVPTVFDNYIKNLFIDGNEFELGLWDTAGQDDYDMLRPLAYPGTNVVLICFSIDNKNSFENVKNKWVPEINQYLPNVPFILVGTQSELRDDFQTINKLSQKGLSPISYQQGFGLSMEVKATKYIECSARNQKIILNNKNPFDFGFEKPFDVGFEKPLQTNETAYQEETKKQVKLVIVGDQESKKTEMIMTYANGQYPTDYVPTIFDNYIKNLFVDGKPLTYPGTNVVLICFSIDNKESFENVKNKWIPEIQHHCTNVPFILVGTQSELRDDFQTINKLSQKGLSPISYQQGFGLSIEVKATKYIECSARNQVNINEVFEEAVRAVNYSSEFDTTENYSEQQKPFDVKSIKCVFVGDQESKKTEMIMTYANGQYPTDYVPTVFDNYVKNLFVDGNEFELGLWDTAPQEDYDRLRPLSYPNTNVVLICFSIVNQKSFENVKNKWVPEINQYLPNVPFILVGTQSELRDDFQTINKLSQKGLSPISYQQGFGLSIEVKATKYIECSARNQINLNEVFEEAVRNKKSKIHFFLFENVKLKFIPEIKQNFPNIPIILIGNEFEKRNNSIIIEELKQNNLEPITFEKGIRTAKKSKMLKYLECSFETKKNLTTILETVSRLSFKSNNQTEKSNNQK